MDSREDMQWTPQLSGALLATGAEKLEARSGRQTFQLVLLSGQGPWKNSLILHP